MNDDFDYDDYTHPLDDGAAILTNNNNNNSQSKRKKNKKKKQQQHNNDSSSDDVFALNTNAKIGKSPTQRSEQLLEQHLKQVLEKVSKNNNTNNNNSKNVSSATTNRFQQLDEIEHHNNFNSNSSMSTNNNNHNNNSGKENSSSMMMKHNNNNNNSSSTSFSSDFLPPDSLLQKSQLVNNNSHAPAAPKFRRAVTQKFDIALVMDFEATCDENTSDYPHEIIEFPVVAIDANCRNCASYSTSMATNKAILGEFQSFVRPQRNPKLTPFCTELTGITQEQVDSAPTLPEVVAKFEVWLKDLVKNYYATSNNNKTKKNNNNTNSSNKNKKDDDGENDNDDDDGDEQQEVRCVFATDGPWDIRKFVFEHSICRDGVYFPPMFFSFLNIRQEYATYYRCKPLNLGQMLGRLGFHFEGKQHSGIDDSRNIARIFKVLLDRGHRFSNPCRIGNSGKEGKTVQESLIRVRQQYRLLNPNNNNNNSNNNNKKKNNNKNNTNSKAQQQQQQQEAAAAAASTSNNKRTPLPPGLDRCLMKMIEVNGMRVVNELFEKFS